MAKTISTFCIAILLLGTCYTESMAQKEFERILVLSEGEDELMADANFYFDKENYYEY